MQLQNDIGVTVRTRYQHCQELTFRMPFFCAGSRRHCLGLPPHVAVSLLLLEPCTSVCGNFDSVKYFDLDGPSKDEEADAQGGVNGRRARNHAGKPLFTGTRFCVSHFRAMDVSSQALINRCEVPAATWNMSSA